MIATVVAELVRGILTSVIVIWFSRQREFRANAGGVRLSSREKMIAALGLLNHGAGGCEAGAGTMDEG